MTGQLLTSSATTWTPWPSQLSHIKSQAALPEAEGCEHLRRLIREGHRCAALRLAVGDAATAAMEELLAELQQLLVGIAIMQVPALGLMCLSRARS